MGQSSLYGYGFSSSSKMINSIIIIIGMIQYVIIIPLSIPRKVPISKDALRSLVRLPNKFLIFSALREAMALAINIRK